MTVAVVIPWAPGCPHRERALAWTVERYNASFPAAEIVLGACNPDLPFNRSEAILDGARRSIAETLIVADGDCWSEGIGWAVSAVEGGVTLPMRVVRSRREKLPPNTVYVGRPTRWGNPFKIGEPHPAHGWPTSRQEAVDLFTQQAGVMGSHEIEDADIEALRGKNLACWCPVGLPCHADVLLEWANG